MQTVKQSEMTENHRSGADGTEKFALLGMCEKSIAHTFVLVKVLGTGHATGNHKEVGIREVGFLEADISLYIYIVGRLYHVRSVDADSNHAYTSTAKDINRSQCLDILEAIGKKYVHFCHNMLFFSLLT